MIVVDTSVALKWFVPEPGSDRAAELIGQNLFAPNFLRIECANAFRKKIVRNEESVENAVAALEALPRFLTLEPDDALIDRAFQIALELLHPVYDCLFLALAERRNAPLATADEKLVARCRGTPFAARFHPW